MCLQIIDKEPLQIEEGWKVFKMHNGKLYGELASTKIERPVNKWLHEKDYRSERYKQYRGMVYIGIEHEEKYPLGWHIFVNKDDALRAYSLNAFIMRCVVRKVKVRGIHTSGINVSRVVVAKEIFIEAKEE